MGKGLSLKRDKIKSKSIKGYSNRTKVIVLLIAIIILVIGLNFLASYNAMNDVEVVKLKGPVQQDGLVVEDNLYKDTMKKAEYEKQGIYTLSDGTKRRAIVLWEDRQRIINTFASYYLRQDAPIYWDSLSKETPKKYSYLYKMDGEFAELVVDADQFGEILVPGDRINVRASYTEQVYTLPNEKDFMMQQQTGVQAQTSVTRRVKLFNNVVVLDMLNSSGESIFDLYYKLLALPKSKQQEYLKDDEFKSRIKPAKLYLNITPEEADNYMDIQGKGATYMVTLLPRTNSNPITEALNELQIGFARD